MNTEYENKMDQIIEETLNDLSNKGVLYESLSDADINVILANAPDIPMTGSFKERARAAMKGEQATQYASSPEKGLESIFARAKKLNITPQELTQKLRLGMDVLMKLDLCLIENVPNNLVHSLSGVLDVTEATIQTYLAQSPRDMQMAATSQKKPARSRTQDWREAIENSSMSGEDKAYWLN